MTAAGLLNDFCAVLRPRRSAAGGSPRRASGRSRVRRRTPHPLTTASCSARRRQLVAICRNGVRCARHCQDKAAVRPARNASGPGAPRRRSGMSIGQDATESSRRRRWRSRVRAAAVRRRAGAACEGRSRPSARCERRVPSVPVVLLARPNQSARRVRTGEVGVEVAVPVGNVALPPIDKLHNVAHAACGASAG